VKSVAKMDMEELSAYICSSLEEISIENDFDMDSVVAWSDAEGKRMQFTVFKQEVENSPSKKKSGA